MSDVICQSCNGSGYVQRRIPGTSGPPAYESGPCQACGGVGHMPQAPAPSPTPPCVCPPGSEMTCKEPQCPRRPTQEKTTP